MTIDVGELVVRSPKRTTKGTSGWEGFFPYYAGFPEAFAAGILRSAGLNRESHVLDPWNGSGTTTTAASSLGITSTGVDINPTMLIVARARELAKSEAISLEPLSNELLERRLKVSASLNIDDELAYWFGASTAGWLRSLEFAVRDLFLPQECLHNLEDISAIASTYYVALFTLCQRLAWRFQSSNPTWLRSRRNNERRIGIPSQRLEEMFSAIVRSMAAALLAQPATTKDRFVPTLMIGDSSRSLSRVRMADVVLTSPPYCTRIDYTAATRLPLAVIQPLAPEPRVDLSRRMMGSTRVPKVPVEPSDKWGKTCNDFLYNVSVHSSRASATYYLNTHLDYFHKLYDSVNTISRVLAPSGTAIMVVQDSYYKNLHNDLAKILSEMAVGSGLYLKRRDDFALVKTLAGTNPRARVYRSSGSANESVLVFQRD